MKTLCAISLLGLMLSSCSALDGYERRYSIGYENREGNRTDFGVTLIPRAKVIREK
jgi:hypothetical protein